jgi:hypothetical protein
MRGPLSHFVLPVATCALLVGCAGTRQQREPPVDAAAASESSKTPATMAAASADAAAAPGLASPLEAEAQFGQIVSELESLGAIDPSQRARLMADLAKTDPVLWPQLIQYFKVSLEHQRGQRIAGNAAATPAALSTMADQEVPTANVGTQAPARLPGSDALDGPEYPHGQTPASMVDPAVIPASAASDTIPPISNATFQASAAAPPRGDWQRQLSETIRELEGQLADTPAPAADDPRHVKLRLLYLAAGRRDDLLRLSPLSAPDSAFWSQELFGLATYLDEARLADPGTRAAEASRHLHEAASTLAEQGTLSVRNLAFCTRVDSYGVYAKFEKEEFQPGEEVLLYAEVRNFRSEATPQGHRTALASSYQVFDAAGRRIDEQEFPVTEERCQNRRHDFFIRYFVRLPERAYDGRHTLQLTIEDTLGHKLGQSTIDFTIKTK